MSSFLINRVFEFSRTNLLEQKKTLNDIFALIYPMKRVQDYRVQKQYEER